MSWDKREDDENETGNENENESFWSRRKKRRVPGSDFDEFFGSDFDKEFEKMRHYMDKLLENLTAGKGESEFGMHGPFVYGFSMRVGPDGKPQLQSFGNVPKGKGVPELREREPLTDVIEGEDSVSITVEIPGVEKEDVNLTATDDTLTIDVDAKERKYHKEIALPCTVIPDSTAATYKNGVLDIVIKRTEKKVERKKKIEIR